MVDYEIDPHMNKMDTTIHIDWQLNFRELPQIPVYKRWDKTGKSTIEQAILNKILNGGRISSIENSVFKDLSKFYIDLDTKLQNLKYKTFSDQDLLLFKNYILYAFNYLALISNDLTIHNTFRLVVNEYVTNNNEPITNIKYLKYPAEEIVRQINKFNRANTATTNVFYSTENIDTALREIRPPINKLVTVGIWKPKTQKKFVSYPISHSSSAIFANEGVAKATLAFEKQFPDPNGLLKNFFRQYFQLLGREYTKTVNNHYEYYISALFSEEIFATKELGDTFSYDCIIYPSVGNEYKTDNLAIRPSVLDCDFQLERVIEFEIVREMYDNHYVPNHPENISLAIITNKKVTNQIDANGIITW